MKETRFSIYKTIKSTNSLLCKRCSCRLGNEKDAWEKELKKSLVKSFKYDKKVVVEIYSYRAKAIDHDNAFVTIKAIIDCFKKDRLGIIDDDSPKHIEGPYFYQFVVRDKLRQRTEIVIREIG
jgi:hypothetical protein